MKNILSLIFIVIASNVHSQSKFDSGMIAYYPLNNNVKDATKNKYDGVLVEGTYVADRFGRSNSALFFDGTNDYAILSKFGKYLPTGDLTITLWAKSVKNVTSNTMMLMPDNTSNRIDISLYYSHNGNGAYFWSYAGISKRIFIEPVSPDGSWEFFTANYNSKTKKVAFYKNCKVLQTVDVTNSYSQDSTRSMHLGMGKDGYYNGTLDEVRFYSRVLDTTELRQLYTMPSSGIKKYSETKGLKLVPDSYLPKVFSVESTIELKSMDIYSVSGQWINQSDLKVLDLSYLPSGIYYIRMKDSAGNLYTKKVMI